MKVAVLDKTGKSTGREIDLPKQLFAIEPNEHVLYLAVKQYLAAQRQGTSKAKTRNEISGSTRKLKKQKGTGTARAGSIKSPVFRGGGTIFGPEPRDYTLKLNKKEKQLAKASALSLKAKNKALIVVEDIELDTPSTKEFNSVMQAIKAEGKVLFVHAQGSSSNLMKSARNIAKLSPVAIQEMNTYNIMNADSLVVSESALKQIVE